MADERDYDLEKLGNFIEENIDLDSVLSLAKEPHPAAPEECIASRGADVTIGVAMDSAFCFYYQDMLDSFRRSGAEIKFFSPLEGEIPDVDGMYFGGGYPELHIAELEKSRTTHKLKDLSADGMPIYGCLLYTSPSPRDRQKSRMPSSA